MISVDNVHVTFRLQGAEIKALDGVTLSVAAGEVFVLLGPSGCGKTTLLRCLAGLETPTAGKIALEGRPMSDAAVQIFVPPHLRPLAMVFQSYAMWPHMNVYDNIAFPLRVGSHKIPPEAVAARVEETLRLLEIAALKERPVTSLSGGQQQRVSLARALALQPRVLLMDEPLSNLDHQLQIQLRGQLRALMRRLQLTTIHVTHNQEEALELGDRIAVLNHGKLVQVADGPTLYRDPANSFVARFLGDMNLFAGAIVGTGLVNATVETRAGRLDARRGAAVDLMTGAWCYFGIRPNDVKLNATEPANTITATVTARRYLGASVLHTLESGPVQFQAATHPAQAIEVGQRTRAHFPIEHAVVVPAADEKPYQDD